MQYYHSSNNNNQVFATPFQIQAEHDLVQVNEALQEFDILEYVRQPRSNSKWIVDQVTNVTFFVTMHCLHPIGKSSLLLSFIVPNRVVASLECDKNMGVPYNENLFFSRFLTVLNSCHTKNLAKRHKPLLSKVHTDPFIT